MKSVLNPAHPPRHRGLLWVIGIVVLALLVGLAWRLFLTPSAPPKASAPPVPVRTALVQQQTVPVTRTGVGNVTPGLTVTVHTRVDGQIDSTAFNEGGDIKAGQVLVRIDPRAYKAQLDQALAQKAKDAALLANARIDLARYQQLIQEDATTRQTLDTQRALVGQLQAALQNDNAQIELARVNLSYTTITAPISGRVGARLVDPGNIVHAADAGGLLVINQIDPVSVRFTLPEASFQALNTALNANAAPLTVQALDRGTGQVLASGSLGVLNNQIDASTGTIMLKADFPNPQHKLWPGQSVDARVVLGQRAQALTVPSAVVQRGANGLFVYVIEVGDKARAQPIQVDDGDGQGGIAVVTQGLSVGQRVVVEGQYRLTPGARIVEMQTGGGQGKGGGNDNTGSAARQPSPPTPLPQAGEGSNTSGGSGGSDSGKGAAR